MKFIVGLGNPDKKYQKTRHNIGWMVLDLLAQKLAQKLSQKDGKKDSWRENKKINALEQKLKIGATGAILLKPLTYMNESGRAVISALKYQPKTNLAADILIIHDDKDLPLGKIKLQINRGSAGHRGVESIIKHLGTKNFARLRIGVAHNEHNVGEKNTMPIMPDTSQFVLSSFSAPEKKQLNDVLAQACAMVEEWIWK